MKKTLTAVVTTLTLAGAMTMSASQAEARWRGNTGAAVAAGVVGAMALGAIAASAAQPRHCYRVKKTEWSPFHGAYLTRRVTVCS